MFGASFYTIMPRTPVVSSKLEWKDVAANVVVQMLAATPVAARTVRCRATSMTRSQSMGSSHRKLRRRECWHTAEPLQSLHWLRIREWVQIAPPPHKQQLELSPPSHYVQEVSHARLP